MDRDYSDFVARLVAETNLDWQNEMKIEGVDRVAREDFKTLVDSLRIANHLCTRAIAAGLIKGSEVSKPDRPGVRDASRACRAVAELYGREPCRVRATARAWVKGKRSEARAKLGMFDPDAEDAVLDAARK